ncbi:MAG: MBOAT family O-acyltransferase [Eubacteriales bacterium]|nr:MBOAT family O-acyltransferase [Eubacteriales bacterium]
MAFFSWQFILFLIVSLVIYYIVPGKFQWVILLFSSAWYYLAAGNLRTCLYVIITVLTTFFGARLMDSIQKGTDARLKGSARANGGAAGGAKLSREEKRQIKSDGQKKKKRVLVLILLINFGILIVLKYGNFVSTNINGVLSRLQTGARLPELRFLLPLGLSFYTFQTMGYLIDVYRGKYSAEKNLLKMALFTTYFPSILQGPINRYDDLAAQLYEPHRFEDMRFREGLLRMLWGFFKKLIIAERAAIIVNEIFNSFEDKRYAGFTLFVGALLYGVQLYADFAGGMDIVFGASEMFGIKLRENFRQPYMARSISEFWQRWHISLGNWMKDYVFYPIALSKPFAKMQKSLKKNVNPEFGKVFPSFLASFMVFVLVGIWHGANWKFVFYGLYQATFVSTETLFEKPYAALRRLCRVREDTEGWKLFQMARTLTILTIGRYVDVVPDMSTVLRALRATFSSFNPWIFFDGSLYDHGVNERNFGMLLLLILLVAAVDVVNERGQTVRGIIARQQLPFRWTVYLAAIAAILVFGMYGPGFNMSSFIYAQF